jgi:hypothetical protein
MVGGTVIVIITLGAPGSWKLLLLPAVLVLGLILGRAARVALELRFEGLVVRNVFRTYQLRWSEIRSFYVGDGYGMKECVGIALKDGVLGIDIAATSDATRDRALLGQLCRYAKPHGIELAPDFLSAK